MEGIRFWHFTYGPTLADRSEIVSDMRIVTQSFMFLGSTGISCRSVRCHYFKILPFSHCLHQNAQPEAELPKSHLHSEDKADGGAHSASDSTPYPTWEPEFEAFRFHATFSHTEVPSTLHFSNCFLGSRKAITRCKHSVHLSLIFLLFPLSASISVFLHQYSIFVARRFLNLIRSSRLSPRKWVIQPMSNTETTRRTNTLLRHLWMTRMSIIFRWVMTTRGPVLVLSMPADHHVVLTLSLPESSSFINPI